MKKILIIFMLLLSLTSCFYDKTKISNTGTGKTMSGKIITGRTGTGDLIKEKAKDQIIEKQKQSILLNVKNEEDRKIWIDLYMAQDLKDSKKIKEITAKLDILEKQKRDDLTRALKENNKEKAKDIQQYLMLFRFEKGKK